MISSQIYRRLYTKGKPQDGGQLV